MSPKPVKLVIFDLDGTLIQTETLVIDIARSVIQSHGKELTAEVIDASIGRRPIEAWEAVAEMLGIDKTAEELFQQSEPLLTHRWHECNYLPGAVRLMAHLRDNGIKMALATSTSRETLRKKLSSKAEIQDMFEHVVCGDEVINGKPAPDCLFKVATSAGVDPSECLVIEDAPSGVQAAAGAGMRVVVIPSLRSSQNYPEADINACSGCVESLPSLLAFQPQAYGLPPFNDFIGEVIPLQPVWHIAGTVVKGFGRGSKELGIPTANLDSKTLKSSLSEAVTGIYCGYASLGTSPIETYKMVMSVGWNPVFNNKEKTCEPWILHDFGDRSFYGEEIRLLVCGYIRPEANFPSLEALVERIHRDGDVSREALEHEALKRFERDEFLLG